MPQKCKYIVAWTSAVTMNRRTSGFPDKKSADRAAQDLAKEGAKDVQVFEYKPCRIY